MPLFSSPCSSLSIREHPPADADDGQNELFRCDYAVFFSAMTLIEQRIEHND